MTSQDIVTFYKFRPLAQDQLQQFASEIETRGEQDGIVGLIIMGVEGVNTTLSGAPENLASFVQWLAQYLDLGELRVKWSRAERAPFAKIRVKLRDEIVTLGNTEIVPGDEERSHHISPEEWHRILRDEPDTLVLDTRNWYETRIGKFTRAIDPNIEEFQEFPKYLEASEIPKDKKILIYCTGGIRCEKALIEMNRQGFNNVWQLDGGILAYLEKFPNAEFDGECFVFDHRVAVQQDLSPSETYQLCPHCGQPAKEVISCVRCDTRVAVCIKCQEGEAGQTCSKNCAYHAAVRPGQKGRPQITRRGAQLRR